MASHRLARMLRRPLGRFFGVAGLLASDSLIQAPRRTSATVAALLFSLSFVVASAIFTRSFKASVVQWMEQVVNPDLVVNTSPSLTEHSYRFPPQLAERLKAVPGVRQVDCVRSARETFRGQGILVISIEMEQFYRRASQIVVDGDDAEIRRRLSAEPVIAVSDNFARLYGIRIGDTVTLQTATGPVGFPVVGIVQDYSSDKGSVFIDRDEYIRHWKDDSVDIFDLMIEPSDNPDVVRNRVLEALRDQGQIFVLTREEFWRDIHQLLDRFFFLSYVQIVVAIFVAVMGIINTLFVSITDRLREFGILRTVGGSAGQVRLLILIEASAMVLIACLLGTVVGAYLGYFVNNTLSVQQSGWYVPYIFPWLLVVSMIPAMLLVAIVAAWFPSSLAVRTRLSEALAYE
jgi:putative ABC transport system permease protein